MKRRTARAMHKPACTTLWLMLLPLAALGCQGKESDPVLPFGTGGSSSDTTSASAEFLAACQGYCAHVYTTAVNCDADAMDTEANACYAFCNIQGGQFGDSCENELVSAYDCVVDNDVLYECVEEGGSAITTETICADVWLVADACMAAR